MKPKLLRIWLAGAEKSKAGSNGLGAEFSTPRKKSLACSLLSYSGPEGRNETERAGCKIRFLVAPASVPVIRALNLLLLLTLLIPSAPAWAQINGTMLPPSTAPTPDEACLPMGSELGLRWSYCDVASGLFSYVHTDISLPGPMPIALRRIYRSEAVDANGNIVPEPFGPGTNFDYGMFLYSESGSTAPFSSVDVILPDGGRVKCGCNTGACTSTDYTQQIFTCGGTPSQTFFGATLQAIPSWQVWDLRTKHGSHYYFGIGPIAPTTGQGALLQNIVDPYGNEVVLTRTNGTTGDVTEIAETNAAGVAGRWIKLQYDPSHPHQVQTATDNASRKVYYSYNSSGQLIQVNDLNNQPTKFITWFNSTDLASITDANGNNTTITYGPSSGPSTAFASVTPPGSKPYTMRYSVGTGGQITAADITDPRGIPRHLGFNSAGYLTAETLDNTTGATDTETTSYVRDSNNFVTQKTDPLQNDGTYTSDNTTYSYDSYHNLISVTPPNQLGSSAAQPIKFGYDLYPADFQALTSVTDALGKTTTLQYDTPGLYLLSITDPLGHATQFSQNISGQITGVTDAKGDKTTYTYTSSGDLASVTSPRGNTTTTYF